MTTETTERTRDERLQEAGAQLLQMIESLPAGLTLTDLLLAPDFAGYERVGGRYTDMRDMRPVERTAEVRRSRIYRKRNPLVDAAVRLWTQTCFEKAWTYTARDEGFQALVDDLINSTRNQRVFSWSHRQRLSRALLTDGEVPFVFFTGGTGVTVRAMDPLEFLDPITNPEDRDEIWYWPRQWYGSDGRRHLWLYRDWDFVDDNGQPRNDPVPQADRDRLAAFSDGQDVQLDPQPDAFATMLTINSEGLRGYPLMTSGLDWVKLHQDFLRDRSALTAERAKYATKISVSGGQKAVDAIRSTIERPDATTPSDGLRQTAGQTWVSNRGVDMDPVQTPADGQSARQDERSLRMMALMPSAIPPHLIGDLGEANLASAEATMPPLRSQLVSYQGLWMEHDQAIFDHVARWLGFTGDTAVDIDAPDIFPQSLIELAQALQSISTTFPAVGKSEEILGYVLTELGLNNVDDVVAVLAPMLEEEPEPEIVRQAMEALRESQARAR